MLLKDCLLQLVDLGEAADTFCRQYPRQRLVSREGNGLYLDAAARDLATHIAIATSTLSPAVRDAIAGR